MTEILPIGSVLKTDQDGFIINESSVAKINSPWCAAVLEIQNIYLLHLRDVIDSIYVRGSVSRGQAIEGVADIDTFAVVTKNPKEIDTSWVKTVRETLKEKFPFASDIEFDFVNLQTLFEGDDSFIYRFAIKAQSACLYGNNLADKIAPIKADFATAKLCSRGFAKNLARAKKELLTQADAEKIQFWCRWIAKRMLRNGFCLVMPEEKVFTRDLYPCYQLFAKHFPDQEPQMKMALELALNPIDDRQKLLNFVEEFGGWLADKINETFN